jgi:hypothetical protein
MPRLAAFAILAVVGCRQPTEVVLEISTDVPCSDVPVTEIRTAKVAVDSRAPAARTSACEPGGRVGSLVLVPDGDDGDPVAVKVVTAFSGMTTERCASDGDGLGCIVARRELHFVPHTKLVVPVAMRADCENKYCPPSQTCLHGACVPAAVDPTVCAGPGGCPDPIVRSVDAGPDETCRPGAARCRMDRGQICGSQGRWQDTSDCHVIAAIAAGSRHTCALRNDGRVQCWGDNRLGQLGLGDTEDRGDGPGEMGAHLPSVDLGSGRFAQAIVAGGDRTCAFLDDDSIKCWGFNAQGVLGFADPQPSGGVPVQGDAPGEMGDGLPAIDFGAGRHPRFAALGATHSCAILDDGGVKCWGGNSDGQLGLGDAVARTNGPRDLPDVDLGTRARALGLFAGEGHTCTILTDKVKCWGRNSGSTPGVLGLGDAANRGDGPGQMGASLAYVDFGTASGRPLAAAGWGAAGAHHTCVAVQDAVNSLASWLKCWGRNPFGELGLNDTMSRGGAPGEMGDALPPTLTIRAADASSEQAPLSGIAAGDAHTCVILSGAVTCWGRNNEGQLGFSGRPTLGTMPGDVPSALVTLDLGRARVPKALAAGGFHTCALLDDERIKCWGANDRGQLGQGDTAPRSALPGHGDELPEIDLGP